MLISMQVLWGLVVMERRHCRCDLSREGPCAKTLARRDSSSYSIVTVVKSRWDDLLGRVGVDDLVLSSDIYQAMCCL